MKKIFPIFLLFFFINISFAQKNNTKLQTIYLTDGSTLKGEILNGDTDSEIVQIRLKSGVEMSVPKDKIAKAKSEKRIFETTKNSMPIQNKGFYFLPQVYLLSAKRAKSWESDNNDVRHSTGLTLTAGYQFFQYLAVGAGVGVNLYENVLMPTFLDVRGNLTKTNPTIYYALNGGYSFRIGEWVDGDDDFVDNKGGFFYYPAIGLKFNARNNVNFQIDVGYNIQRQEREWTSQWGSQPAVDKIVYRSLAIRAGVSF